jgi:Co/Zn/Cd efflux system component
MKEKEDKRGAWQKLKSLLVFAFIIVLIFLAGDIRATTIGKVIAVLPVKTKISLCVGILCIIFTALSALMILSSLEKKK